MGMKGSDFIEQLEQHILICENTGTHELPRERESMKWKSSFSGSSLLEFTTLK